MPTEITIPHLYWSQVCSDMPVEKVIEWMDEREESTAKWMLATPEIMAKYGSGDRPVVSCREREGHKHYLLVVEGIAGLFAVLIASVARQQ